MRTRGRVLATVAALTAAGTVALGAAPAQAGTACPAKTFCLYQFKSYGGDVQMFAYNAHFKNLYSWSDRGSSMINNTGYAFRMYSKTNYAGRTYTAKAHTRDSTFVNNGFDNAASSLRSLG